MKATKLFREFFESEKAGGLILIVCTILSLILANSAWGESYAHFWHNPVMAGKSIEYWINDGLMAIFFLLIGLEIEREVYTGELSNIKNALLPVSAALGGMLFPALFHFGFNYGTIYQSGFGIPMATDIAFSLGILSLLGSKVPTSLKIFLTALAIIDDLGAIIVIALFYSKGFSLVYFTLALSVFGAMLLLNRYKIMAIWIYIIMGFGMWYCMLNSGVHATISGVLLAFAIPFRKNQESSPSFKLQHLLHKPVSFFVVPLFALANTGILIPANWASELTSGNSLGILVGLILGKPLGIVLFSLLAVSIGLCKIPADLSKKHIIGAGILAGIGFTMSIFITILAYTDSGIIISSKIAVFIASSLSGIIGFVYLKRVLIRQKLPIPNFDEDE
jgi:NhaA family Na+:H+ antiporter